MSSMRQLSLIKGGHLYIFRYRKGNEANVIQSFSDLASAKTTNFDWFDAAVLCYQVGQNLEVELRRK